MRRVSTGQLPFPFESRCSYAREDFVPGEANAEALAFVDAWPAWPARVCALWGPVGSGKTHLGEIWRKQSSAEALDVRALDVETVAGLAAGGAFFVDDVDGVEGGAALFHLLNFVNQTNGWLLMTGCQAPQHWPTKVPDLHSRLTAVPGVSLDVPDEGLIARVLLKLFGERQLKVPEALIDYLVPRLERSFADAERIVVLVDRLALQQKRNISVDIGTQAFRLLAAERQASADNGEGLV